MFRAAKQLVEELQTRFPKQDMLDALGIFCPQYWPGADVEKRARVSFLKHLDILKVHCGVPRKIKVTLSQMNSTSQSEGISVLTALTEISPPVHEPAEEVQNQELFVPTLLNKMVLDSESGLFFTTMLSNAEAAMERPLEMNPLTRLWRTITANTCLVYHLPTFIKLAEVVVVHVLRSVEDERCFSSLAFLKSKLHNALDPHFELVVAMYSQQFFNMRTIPFYTTFD